MAVARNAKVQELLDQFVVSNNISGKQRAVWTLYRNLANTLGRDMEDSGELVEALVLLRQSRDLAVIGSLNPRPVSASATASASVNTKPIKGGAGKPEVTGS